MDMDPDELARSCNVHLMGIAYRWACGEALRGAACFISYFIGCQSIDH